LGVTALCPGFVATNLFQNALRPTAEAEAKTPPRWLCTTPEKVASAAVKAVRRNRGLVIVEPVARAMYVAKRFAPSLLDFLHSIGRRKRIAAKELTWNPDVDQPTEATPPRRAA
jgi:short-subunit dehydrogenase